MGRNLFLLCSVLIALALGSSKVIGQVDVEVFISLVNVWVKAVDSSGNPVTDLKQEDFEIFEDGQKMTIECFEQQTLDLAKEPAAVKDAPKFVIYLDLLNTDAGDLLFIKPKLVEFLDQLSPLSYEIMVFALLPNGKLGVVRPYTRNTVQVKATIEQAKGNPALDGEFRTNETQIRALLNRLEPEPDPVISIEDLTRAGRDPIVDRNNQLLRAAHTLTEQFARQERSRAEVALHALESAGLYLAKKHEGAHTIIIYLSGGFNADPGRHYYDLVEQTAERKGLIFDRQVYALRSGKTEPERFDMTKLLQSTLGKLNRLNVTLYSIGTGGMATLADASRGVSNPDSNIGNTNLEGALHDSLRTVANETGGLAFANSQNFKVGFDRITADLSHNYLLCFTPPEHKTPQYREIKVVCKRPGVSVRHRKGYWD